MGVLVAHLMFELSPLIASTRIRMGTGQRIAESVATLGLLLAIAACRRRSLEATAGVVACYIAAAYWFTASTSFANPAVTAARAATDTFAGIRPSDAPGFMLAQVAGAVVALGIARLLWPKAGEGRDGA
jgi:glycerol uptake facilitator-like aquaporin